MVEIDITKYEVVPRLRNENWVGIPTCLWAKIFDASMAIPNAPIVTFGLDNPSTVVFPERQFFVNAGYTEEIVMEKAISFLERQNPKWEDLQVEESLALPRTLLHNGDYGSEQILNKKFLAEACSILNSSMIFVGAMNQNSTLAIAYTENRDEIFKFISLQLFVYGNNPTTQISPGVFIADKTGKLIAGLGYSQSVYDDIMKTIADEDDSNVGVSIIQRQGKEVLQVIAYGSNPVKLFSTIWTIMVLSSNKIAKEKPVKNSSPLEVDLVLITDKMPPIELFEREINNLKLRISGSAHDMEQFGINGMYNLNVLYKKSTSLLI